MILKAVIGFVAITAFVVGVLCIEAVCRCIKYLILKTRFGEWYKNNLRSYADNIGMVVALLIILCAFFIASYQLGTWIMGGK